VTTIRDVAERAQVSIGTVSRVLNDHPSVNPIFRRAVLEAIEALGFRPNAVARTLRTARTRTLGLLLPSMRNAEVVSSVVEGAEAAAHEFGYTLLIGHTRGDRRTEAQYIQNLVDRRVDGIICYTAVALGRDRDRLLRNGVPLLVLSPPTTNDLFPEATLNFGQATEEAIDHLHDLGHCRIGTITHASASDLDVSVGWGVGFIRRTLDLRGLNTDRRLHVAAHSTVECARLVRDLLLQPQPPTALLVTPLYLVPATIAGIRSAGARIPHDLSVIGFGDSEWVEALDPPLSVVAADLVAYLNAATRRLIAYIEEGGDGVSGLEQHAQYIRRASVASAPAETVAT
jgi:LacI family transcriptional regulator